VKYLAWTGDNLLRQVVYEGLREDKPAAEVRREMPHQKPGCGEQRSRSLATTTRLTLQPLFDASAHSDTSATSPTASRRPFIVRRTERHARFSH